MARGTGGGEVNKARGKEARGRNGGGVAQHMETVTMGREGMVTERR